MKKNTIKWRIFKYNLIVIFLLIALATIIFNVAIRIYIEKDTINQLNKIASRTEDTALQQGPDFFKEHKKMPPPPDDKLSGEDAENEVLRFYFMLDRSLREPLSVLNADYILLDQDKNRINNLPDEFFDTSIDKAPNSEDSADILNKITYEINNSPDSSIERYLDFNISGTEYVAIVKPVSEKNSFGLGWIIIYSSLQKINQMKMGINTILLVILVLSALVIVMFSSLISKRISAPFSSLNKHIRAIAERNFGTKILVTVDDELQEFVNNINIMSEKLETYDKAQKTFLQNASHEFRTPLMSIQSYAEGMKYEVVDKATAADIIIDESKRMTHLVEDLLYLSRLDTIEENYHFNNLDYNELINSCVERMNGIAIKGNIKITANNLDGSIMIFADEEKLSRAITNIVSNCIRYAKSGIVLASKIIENRRIELTISDDGPGFDENDLPNIFERFYKGKKGNFGLGLAISKNVIEKHNGIITAENSESGGAVFIIRLPIVQPG